MSSADVQRLVEHLQRRVGDDLRAVLRYDEGECELVYEHERVRGGGLREDAERVISHLRQESRGREQRVFPFGELNGTVRSFEAAVVMHFPLAQARGVVVTLDPNTARQLNAFMHECIDYL